MNWRERMDEVARDGVFLAIATTGISDESELMAVSMLRVGGAAEAKPITFYRKLEYATDAEAVQEYTGISTEMIRNQGLSDNELKEVLEERLGGRCILTFNTGFQLRYLVDVMTPGEMTSLPTIIALAKSGRVIDEIPNMSLQQYEQYAYKRHIVPLSFNKLVKSELSGVLADGSMPWRRVEQLQALYQKLEQYPYHAQQTMFLD